MIPRYTLAAMAQLWTDEYKASQLLEIECLVAEAQAELGIIPTKAAQDIRLHAKFDLNRVAEIEKETRHDVLALLTNIGEHLPQSARRFLHFGLTSSDVLDTVLALQLKAAADILLAGLQQLYNALKKRALAEANTLCMGRSHGIFAEPTSFGLKLAGHACAFKRGIMRLKQAQAEISFMAFSGAVGTYATIDPRIEKSVAQKLGLNCEPVSTQIIPRDRHAHFFATLGIIASSIENLAIEIRHLQRSEVREAYEPFASGQKGSSAMPHKRNPVLSENLTGLARLVRGMVTPALENVALWHERDISHSAVERVIAPDATQALDFAIMRLATLIENMHIDHNAMAFNVNASGGLYASQRVLLALTEKGLSREEAYALVQRVALNVWDNRGDFMQSLQQEPLIKQQLTTAELDALFDKNFYLKNIDAQLAAALID